MPSPMRLRIASLVVLIALVFSVSVPPVYADDLGYDRANFKAILKNVSSDVEKNFYDPTLKGLEWKTLVDQAKTKIDNAKSVGDMVVAIYVVLNKLQDSHTVFMPPSRSTKFYYGFEAKAIDNDVRIYELKNGDPAQRAGLQLGDKIVSINGFRADRPSYDFMMFDFKALRPRPSLELVVQTGSEPPRNVHLDARVKKEANLLGVDTRGGDIWSAITEDENYLEEHKYHSAHYADGQIGYAQLREFPGGDDSQDFLKGVLEHGAGTKAMIIDLRSNPGGSIETLKKIIGCFEQSQVTVLNEVSRKKTEPWIVKPQKPNFAMPMFILIDSRTGSAAEIFARHFQRTGKAVVIGDHSPGRVTVSKEFGGLMGAENAIPFGAQIGIARAVFPDGEELEKKGVTPDVVCNPTGEDMRTENDVCLDKAIELARQKANIKDAPPVEKRTLTGQ